MEIFNTKIESDLLTSNFSLYYSRNGRWTYDRLRQQRRQESGRRGFHWRTRDMKRSRSKLQGQGDSTSHKTRKNEDYSPTCVQCSVRVSCDLWVIMWLRCSDHVTLRGCHVTSIQWSCDLRTSSIHCTNSPTCISCALAATDNLQDAIVVFSGRHWSQLHLYMVVMDTK